MIALLLDVVYAAACLAAGLASVRVAGVALNARARRRHAACLRRIEKLEIANGYRDSPRFAQVRYHEMLSGTTPMVFEMKPGSSPPVFHPAPRPHPLLDDLVAKNLDKSAYANLAYELRLRS